MLKLFPETSIVNTVFRRVRKIAKAAISFVMSACLSVRLFAWNYSAPTGRISMKFHVLVFCEYLSVKFKQH